MGEGGGVKEDGTLGVALSEPRLREPTGLLGVVMAGGSSRRFGGDKALFPLAGRPMAEWPLMALSPWTVFQGVIANAPEAGEALGVPWRSDHYPDAGPLGGLHAALSWAEEEGLTGVLALACDLPLVSSDLLGRLVRAWPEEATVVVPESPGPLGFEPLCAGYRCRALPQVQGLLETGGRSMREALERLDVHRIPLPSLGTPREVELAFTNVNEPKVADRAREILEERFPTGAGTPVVCIIGRKNSGKTELTVALAAELNRRGYRVMTAKHGHGFQLDQPGRDSWRHRHEGGAHRTVLAGPSEFGVVGGWPDGEMTLGEVVKRFLGDADIVLAEGFKRAPEPKIEVFRGEGAPEPLLADGSSWSGRTVALVTDRQDLRVPVPTFSLSDPDFPRDLADFVCRRFLSGNEQR